MLSFFRNKNIETKLFFHTDIHSHVCPGIDDGAANIETAVNLVNEMAQLGINRMIVTPHVTDETFPNTPEIIFTAYTQLTDAVKTAEIDMQFSHSAEYRIDDLFFYLLEKNQITPLPNNFILLENSWYQEHFNFETILFHLQNDYNLRPILAHPERYIYYHKSPNRYKTLHQNGLLFQINILSLTGHYGKAYKQIAEWLLENNLIDFIGSDLHRLYHIEAIKKYINTKDYRKLLEKQHLIKNDTTFL